MQKIKTYLTLATIFVGSLSHAVDRSLPAVPPGFLQGMEIELSAPWLAKLMPLFDFSRFQNEVTHAYVHRLDQMVSCCLDDYILNNRAALETLPEYVRKELTQGLQLNPLLQGEEFSTDPQNGFVRPRAWDWSILNERWNNLPADQRVRLIQWEMLSPLNKANLMIRSYDTLLIIRNLNDTSAPRLQIKADAPHDVKKLFAKLSWDKDQDAIEFRHRHPVDDPREFARDVFALAGLAGITSKIADADKSRLKGASFHYHMSLKDRVYSENFYFLVERLIEVKRISQGIISDLTGLRHVVRRPADDRIEYRAHPYEFYEGQRLFVGLQTMPEQEAIVLLKRKIFELLTDAETFERILHINPSYLFQDSIIIEEIKANYPHLLSVLYDRCFAHDSNAYLHCLRYLRSSGTPMPKELWQHLAHLFSKFETVDFDYYFYNQDLEPEHFERLADVALITSQQNTYGIFRIFANAKHPPPQSALAKMAQVAVRYNLFYNGVREVLYLQKEWSLQTWKKMIKKSRELPLIYARELAKEIASRTPPLRYRQRASEIRQYLAKMEKDQSTHCESLL